MTRSRPHTFSGRLPQFSARLGLKVAVVLGIALSGCRSDDRIGKTLPNGAVRPAPSNGGVADSLKDALNTAGSVLDSATQTKDMAAEEIEKLFRIEYRVVDIPRSLSSQKTEAVFNQLGQQMWDCYHFQPTDDGLRVYCKRRPRSYLEYLRYMPGIF